VGATRQEIFGDADLSGIVECTLFILTCSHTQYYTLFMIKCEVHINIKDITVNQKYKSKYCKVVLFLF